LNESILFGSADNCMHSFVASLCGMIIESHTYIQGSNFIYIYWNIRRHCTISAKSNWNPLARQSFAKLSRPFSKLSKCFFFSYNSVAVFCKSCNVGALH
jgi:hypothetical protein